MCLEENREEESYRWVTLEQKRLLAGHVNPASIEESLKIHRFLLQLGSPDIQSSAVIKAAR